MIKFLQILLVILGTSCLVLGIFQWQEMTIDILHPAVTITMGLVMIGLSLSLIEPKVMERKKD